MSEGEYFTPYYITIGSVGTFSIRTPYSARQEEMVNESPKLGLRHRYQDPLIFHHPTK